MPHRISLITKDNAMIMVNDDMFKCALALHCVDHFGVVKVLGPFNDMDEAMEYAQTDEECQKDYLYHAVPCSIPNQTPQPNPFEPQQIPLSWRESLANDMLEVADKLVKRNASHDYAVRAVQSLLDWMKQFPVGKTPPDKGS